MKEYDKNKKFSYLKYWNKNNLYGWALQQKLTENGFEWVENICQFNENYMTFKMVYHFCHNLHDKKEYVGHLLK